MNMAIHDMEGDMKLGYTEESKVQREIRRHLIVSQTPCGIRERQSTYISDDFYQ